MKRFSFDGPFDLSLTVSCGQAFRWKEEDGYWSAPVNGSVWKVRQIDDTLLYDGCSEGELIHYFALDTDLDEILASIDTDPLIHKANLGCNCGSAGLDIGLQFDIGATTKMSVPFQYNIHF